jgi:hypothetical protein
MQLPTIEGYTELELLEEIASLKAKVANYYDLKSKGLFLGNGTLKSEMDWHDIPEVCGDQIEMYQDMLTQLRLNIMVEARNK